MSSKFNLHLGPISVGTDGLALHHGLKVGAEIGVLGVGMDANAALTTGEFGATAEAFAQHTSNWYALQPITCPGRAFGNLLKQVDADYRRYVPCALRVDGPGIYERLLQEMVLPKLRELGWSEMALIRGPKYIYGRFRVELSAGGHLFLKYGDKDSDGFKWYGVSASMALGAQARVAAAVGLLDNDACQIRIAVANLRLSFILSKRPLGLRNDEEALVNTTLAEQLAFEASLSASSSHSVCGHITLDGGNTGDSEFVKALGTALVGALSGVVGVGRVSVRSVPGCHVLVHADRTVSVDSRLSRWAFDVCVDDPHDVHAVRSALEAEAASGGARTFLPVLTEALECSGLGSGHLRVKNFELDSEMRSSDLKKCKISSL
eukprot:gnl/MRDRNA2_/MRDRNA2_98010_c0_seq1.p1 gnl/MRDRNA2_/MRDRNA2_98010_c0~~gnl/MRDRNA2_/MRDRNA2_98010_c0_seq1.p1  ORF type:complete len:377 (+),score=48.53 gnl/MRDRNA2_/MRDRNA2_98010_c0_seq1:84-1214(+)